MNTPTTDSKRSMSEELFAACRKGKVEAALDVLERGGQSNDVDAGGWAPLHFAVRHDAEVLVRELVIRGADLHMKSDLNWQPIHSAASSRHPKMVELLLALGADVNARDHEGTTPLHIAAASGRADMVTVLVNHGADTDAVNQKGNTALHLTVEFGRLDATQALLNHGARVDAVDQDGLSPLRSVLLTMRLAGDKLKCALMLAAHGAKTDKILPGPGHDGLHWHRLPPLHAAVVGGFMPLAQRILEGGADLEVLHRQKTAMDEAQSRGHQNMVSLLQAWAARRAMDAIAAQPSAGDASTTDSHRVSRQSP